MKQTVAIGIGNTLLSDEGVGVRVIRRLAREAGTDCAVEFVDAGSGGAGLKLLHLLSGRRKAVLVDCCRMGEPPGTIRRFLPHEARSAKRTPGFSLHEGDLLATLDLCRRQGDCPERIVIFGIEPESVEPGEELSPTLAATMDACVAAVRAEL